MTAPEPWPDNDYGLVGVARDVALALKMRYPFVVFTNGRRSRELQAAVMASNEHESPGWLDKTYSNSLPKRSLLRWVWTHPLPTRDDMRLGFLSVLDSFSDSELRHLTRHLSGEAFDIEPCPERPEVAEFLSDRASALGGKFLDHEGGLSRYHWQAP
jgi:hypothetical protein